MRRIAIIVILALVGIILAGCVGASPTSDLTKGADADGASAATQLAQTPLATHTPPAMMVRLEPSFTPPSPRTTEPAEEHSQEHDDEHPAGIGSATPRLTPDAESLPGMLPDLQNLPPSDLRLIYDPESGRRFVRFQNGILNAGPGALELVGRPSEAGEIITVSQRVYGIDGELPRETLVGAFIFHPEHNHWHLDGFAIYEIWSLDAQGELLSPVARGGKVSYCVMDSHFHGQGKPDSSPTPQPTYTTCYEELQGISPGWVDIYYTQYPGQYVEITDLVDGVYALISTVDPEDRVQETLEDNNAGVTYFELIDLRLQILEQPLISPASTPTDR